MASQIHPFFALQPRLRFSKSTNRSKAAFLSIPAEVRLLICEYAVVLPFDLCKPTHRRYNTKVRQPDWKYRDAITDCFNFMQTCRTVHQEASPIFWGKNIFLIDAAPIHGLWPRPDTREDADAIAPFASTNNDWRINIAVKSAASQKMIRRLCWRVSPDLWCHNANGQWNEKKYAKFNENEATTMNLRNVQDFYIILDSRHSRKFTTRHSTK